MAAQAPTTYNPQANYLVIDGVELDGFSDDGISIEAPDESELSKGMDDGVTFEYNPDTVFMVTVSFRAASSGAKRMEQIREAVIGDVRSGLAHPDIQGIAWDPINGSGVEAPYVFFMNKPSVQLQKQSGTVEYKLAFVNGVSIIGDNLTA